MDINNAALLKLLQITDSSFPTGGYAFSHGLESLVLLAEVRSAADVADYCLAQVEETLSGIELPAVRIGFGQASAANLQGLFETDRIVNRFKVVPVFRESSRKLGRRLLESTVSILPGSFVSDFLEAIDANHACGHHSVAFGAIAALIGVDSETAMLAFGSSSLNGYVAAAVRLGVIGQRAAQSIISALQPSLIAACDRAESIGINDLGAYSPMIDLAGLHHGSQPARQFSS